MSTAVGARKGKESPPSTNGDGRDDSGRFAGGNRGGPGNPFAKQVAGLRAALMSAVTPDDIREIAVQLILQAKTGDIQAIKELFDRVFGKAAASVDLTTGGETLYKVLQGVSQDDL